MTVPIASADQNVEDGHDLPPPSAGRVEHLRSAR